MNKYYECHITMSFEPKLKEHITELGWKYSCIKGDPLFGDSAVLCYATRHFNAIFTVENVVEEMARIAKEIGKKFDGVVKRQKVELVVYDTKEIK